MKFVQSMRFSRVLVSTCVLTMVAGVAYAERPALNPNSKKYRTKSVASTSNRSGSATLAVRALLAKDGNTDVEMITRPDFDGTGAAPGQISKVQMKVSGSGGVEFTRNYNNLSGGGHLTYTYPAIPRGTGIQVQTNIRGIDPKRTDVVTVSTTSKLRPDLSVTSITHPARARVNTPVQISAVVAELNGDLGATGNCVLSVNGTAVDQAPAIWVDGGDSVSCAFVRTFPTSGQYALSVAVTDVTPADYDSSNNAKSSSIDVGGKFTYMQASVYKNTYNWENTRNWWYHYSYWYWYAYYSGTEYGTQQWGQSGSYDGIHAWANKDSASPFPITDVRATVTADDAPLYDTQFAAVTPDWTNPATGDGCAYRSVTNANGRVFHLNACSYGNASYLWYNSYGGSATYYSNAWWQRYYEYYYYGYYGWYSYSGSYSGSWSSNGAWGNPASAMPSAAKFNIEFALDGAVDSIDVFPTVTPWSSSWNYCYNDYYYYYGGSCYTGTNTGQYLRGSNWKYVQ